ncbi:unnamed protein product, partial [Meganyctiphanes norvegica]
ETSQAKESTDITGSELSLATPQETDTQIKTSRKGLRSTTGAANAAQWKKQLDDKIQENREIKNSVKKMEKKHLKDIKDLKAKNEAMEKEEITRRKEEEATLQSQIQKTRDATARLETEQKKKIFIEKTIREIEPQYQQMKDELGSLKASQKLVAEELQRFKAMENFRLKEPETKRDRLKRIKKLSSCAHS